MVISTNLISATSGRKVGEFLTSNTSLQIKVMIRYKQSGQLRKISTMISRVFFFFFFFGNNILIEFTAKTITFMTHFGGSQVTS